MFPSQQTSNVYQRTRIFFFFFFFNHDNVKGTINNIQYNLISALGGRACQEFLITRVPQLIQGTLSNYLKEQSHHSCNKNERNGTC